jgi:hypothetical protein
VKFVDQFGRLHRFSLGMNGVPANDTGLQMTREKFDSERIERGSNRGNLIEDINTVSILFDHALDPGDLTGDPIGSAPDAIFRVDLHGIYIYHVWVFLQAFFRGDHENH